MNSSLLRRIGSGFGANAFGQVATVAIQVGSLPLFLHYWGVSLYGDWLVLSAIPAYFALSDIGFSSVAANDMTMLVSRGDRTQAQQVFQSIWLLISGISACIAVFIVAGTYYFPIERWCNIRNLSHLQMSFTLQILCIHVLVGLQGGMVAAGYRCAGNYARGTFFYSVIRMAEFVCMAVAVCVGAGAVGAAAAYLFARSVGTVLTYYDLRRFSPWLRLGKKDAQWHHVLRLARPSIAFMAFPVGNALSLQGMIVIVGAVLGPVMTVTFATMRTLSRFPLQVTNSVNAAVWPELSAAYGVGDIPLARALHVRSVQCAFYFSLMANCFIGLTAKWIVSVWSHHRIVFEPHVMALLLVVVFVNSLWSTSSVTLASTNRHQRMAVLYIAVSAVSLLLGYFLLPVWALVGVAVALLVAEMLMCTYVVKMSLELLDDKPAVFVYGVLRLPSPQSLWALLHRRGGSD